MIRNRYTCISIVQIFLYSYRPISPIQPSYSRYKFWRVASNPHSTQNFVVLYVYVRMHALPGIVDGARKSSQGGRWIWVDARGGGTTCRYSSFAMVEATTSREQCMSAVTSIVHYGARVSSAVGTAQRI